MSQRAEAPRPATALRERAASLLSRAATGMSREDAARWKTAATMADLGELVIAWLNGEITQTPGHCGPPAGETLPLIDVLTDINRGGFVTDNSQLAESMDGRTWNTWVAGFAADETLARIRAAVAGTPLTVQACRGRAHECRPSRAFLQPCPRKDSVGFWADACPDAADVLRDAWWVHVEDPQPGRNSMWPILAAALH